MKLTPEQKADVERQKAAGQRRILINDTPEQRADYERLVAVEEAGREENLAYFRKRELAAREPGFTGDLRRAIAATRKPPETVAREAGVDPLLIDRFCCGEAILPGDVIDRLVGRLGLRLTHAVQ